MMRDIPISELDTLQGVLDLLSDRIPITDDELAEAQVALNDVHRWCENESSANAELHEYGRQQAQRAHDAVQYAHALETLTSTEVLW